MTATAGAREFDVCIAVMNIDEEGKITLRDKDGKELVQPYAHGPITADLTDPDGVVNEVTWVWRRAQIDPPGSGDNGRNAIDEATSPTYTPTNADTSFFLHVAAAYRDMTSGDPVDTDDRNAEVTAMHAVLEVEDQKRPPEFPSPVPGPNAMRMVAENAPSTTFVGEPLPEAMDLDDPQGEGLTYTLEGDDTEFFELLVVDPTPDSTANDDERATTQIRVKLHDEAHDLNNEAEGRNGMYEVVLKVTDGSGLEDTVTVTIMVTDRNEAPTMPMEATDDDVVTPPDANNAPAFPATEDGMRSVPENTIAGTDIGAPVMATDADTGDTLMYTLGGADMASFAIDDTTGQLMTMAALDYETKDSYIVEVMADDGNGGTDTIEVTINVEDVSLGTAADTYDSNKNEVIDSDEVLNAVEDYFNDVSGIDSDLVLDIVELYFSS